LKTIKQLWNLTGKPMMTYFYPPNYREACLFCDISPARPVGEAERASAVAFGEAGTKTILAFICA
jgi:hypothetical protein